MRIQDPDDKVLLTQRYVEETKNYYDGEADQIQGGGLSSCPAEATDVGEV